MSVLPSDTIHRFKFDCDVVMLVPQKVDVIQKLITIRSIRQISLFKQLWLSLSRSIVGLEWHSTKIDRVETLKKFHFVMQKRRSSSRIRRRSPAPPSKEALSHDEDERVAVGQPNSPKSPTLVSTKTNTEENDTSLNFFYKPHTVSALIVMLAVFIYVALWVTEAPDTMRNVKMYIKLALKMLNYVTVD